MRERTTEGGCEWARGGVKVQKVAGAHGGPDRASPVGGSSGRTSSRGYLPGLTSHRTSDTQSTWLASDRFHVGALVGFAHANMLWTGKIHYCDFTDIPGGA